ncbi:hypothetical protein EK904_002954 [Melospiza melodia maxima]|nr:hypothetical protein EK904_002954 [Melospiza melodia maxima]
MWLEAQQGEELLSSLEKKKLLKLKFEMPSAGSGGLFEHPSNIEFSAKLQKSTHVTGTRPWLLLAFCASLGPIPSRRGADVLPVGDKQGDTGQDQFLPTPGMGFVVSEGAWQPLTRQGWGRQRVPLLRYSLGDAEEEAVTLETAAALPGIRARNAFPPAKDILHFDDIHDSISVLQTCFLPTEYDVFSKSRKTIKL